MRALAIACAVAILTLGAHAAPSYDCNKAATAAEKEICEVPDLQWFDRQLARLYKLAKDQASNEQAVVTAQRAFIARREACRTDAACIERAYGDRLAELAPQVNVHEAYAEYESENGSLWIARFGFEAGVRIVTVGGNAHICAFETDNATVGGKGVIRWRDDVCRIDIVPDGEALRVETKNCQHYCGVRAVMDGVFVRREALTRP